MRLFSLRQLAVAEVVLVRHHRIIAGAPVFNDEMEYQY